MFLHGEITKDLTRAKKFFEDILAFTIGSYSLDNIVSHKIDTVNIVDVRDYNDYISGHIPYAMHIPYDEAREHIDMLDKNKVTIVYTYTDSCPRAYHVALNLIEKHYPTVVLRGGFKAWKKFDFDIIKSDTTDYKESNTENTQENKEE
jgi:rhodanese-related sulfurtransferase